jgi:hypothetical protein
MRCVGVGEVRAGWRRVVLLMNGLSEWGRSARAVSVPLVRGMKLSPSHPCSELLLLCHECLFGGPHPAITLHLPSDLLACPPCRHLPPCACRCPRAPPLAPSWSTCVAA